MAKKKEDTVVDTTVILDDTTVVVDETPVVETVEVDKFPGHNTRAFRQ
jgi:hypothetical protein